MLVAGLLCTPKSALRTRAIMILLLIALLPFYTCKALRRSELVHRSLSALRLKRSSLGRSNEIDDMIEKELTESGSQSSKKRSQIEFCSGKKNNLNSRELINRAVFAGIFVAGIGTGITVDSAINTNPKDLASRDAIDKNAPNPKLCATYGSSAMVMDQRVFVTFNPFNVYVTQADTKPGCVIRSSNVVNLLQKERNLITNEDVQACKNGFNTWAFVGDINDRPQLNCVFQSDDAQNEFLSDPKLGLGEDIYDPQVRGGDEKRSAQRSYKILSKGKRE